MFLYFLFSAAASSGGPSLYLPRDACTPVQQIIPPGHYVRFNDHSFQCTHPSQLGSIIKPQPGDLVIFDVDDTTIQWDEDLFSGAFRQERHAGIDSVVLVFPFGAAMTQEDLMRVVKRGVQKETEKRRAESKGTLTWEGLPRLFQEWSSRDVKIIFLSDFSSEEGHRELRLKYLDELVPFCLKIGDDLVEILNERLKEIDRNGGAPIFKSGFGCITDGVEKHLILPILQKILQSTEGETTYVIDDRDSTLSSCTKCTNCTGILMSKCLFPSNGVRDFTSNGELEIVRYTEGRESPEPTKTPERGEIVQALMRKRSHDQLSEVCSSVCGDSPLVENNLRQRKIESVRGLLYCLASEGYLEKNKLKPQIAVDIKNILDKQAPFRDTNIENPEDGLTVSEITSYKEAHDRLMDNLRQSIKEDLTLILQLILRKLKQDIATDPAPAPEEEE